MAVRTNIFRVAVCVMTVTAAPALAATTYDITPQYGTGSGANVFKDHSGANSWKQVVSFTANGHNERGYAGLFRLQTGTPASDFLAFCLSPTTTLDLSTTYRDSPDLGLSTTSRGQLGALVSNAWSLVTNSRSAAAFQLAAWEIVVEDGSHGLNLYDGSFRVTSARQSTRGLATGWLSNITDNSWSPVTTGFTLLEWTEPTRSQNLITADLPQPATVPLPGAGFLMLAGLGTLAGLRRRRKTAI